MVLCLDLDIFPDSETMSLNFGLVLFSFAFFTAHQDNFTYFESNQESNEAKA